MSRIVRFHELGGPDVLRLEEVSVAPPGPGEVQIRPRALGINRAEVMYRTGQYLVQPEFPAVIGYEAAGTVEAVGEGVSEFAIGDAVSVIPAFSFADYGVHGELVNAPVHAVVRHPANLSFEQAAAAWMMYTTAYGALIDIADLQPGDTVLIRAASSSVGLAAIQIANQIGAIPVALTRTDSKRQALLDAGAQHVIATEEQDLIEAVERITAGEGARVAFDPVGGRKVRNILKTLKFGGFFFQYGALETDDLTIPVMELLGKDLTIRGYQLFEVTGDPQRMQRARDFIHAGLASGQLAPIIARSFPLEEMAEAHRYMESNSQIGKIIVTV
ncbi:NADPH:quinone reductase-like Zn-dependent oxidoreductase [Kushneria sinocarnis]|uniref:NADPH:quinone reductase-like Zn-dependent oxidoreductase n=1 Tax=Kushneria sinocarnis TaxID=595502 RepID=A0A420WW44_9GAMM|nr:zinc-dependent alcohol dehydrogenase family protein [Kushneria sinocarnis]RKR03313.1 NADPH:quinone reductase-like Zn-dependent oxidoreductase [Kushneria sinocarnis]